MPKYNVYNLYRGTISQGSNYTETEALFWNLLWMCELQNLAESLSGQNANDSFVHNLSLLLN